MYYREELEEFKDIQKVYRLFVAYNVKQYITFKQLNRAEFDIICDYLYLVVSWNEIKRDIASICIALNLLLLYDIYAIDDLNLVNKWNEITKNLRKVSTKVSTKKIK